MKKSTKNLALVGVLSSTLLFTSGCGFVKPYDKPEFKEIEPNQTAFVIPLEGKTSDQGKFESEKFLKDAQVATKRIEVPHKWIKTGRMPGSGKWVDTVRVIVVDRFPETREWSGENAFVGESKDSIKFNQGMSATAQIMEEDTATFLYQYSGKKLEDVMNKEIRNKIGSVLLEKYGSKPIDGIRSDKGSIIKAVREEVEPYFKERGITLSNIGYIGDLQYLQADIQEAINKDFKAQQDKKAQETINAKNEAQAQSELKQAQTKQSAMETMMKMRELELQGEWIKKWDGKLPQVQGSENDGQIISVPKPDSK